MPVPEPARLLNTANRDQGDLSLHVRAIYQSMPFSALCLSWMKPYRVASCDHVTTRQDPHRSLGSVIMGEVFAARRTKRKT